MLLCYLKQISNAKWNNYNTESSVQKCTLFYSKKRFYHVFKCFLKYFHVSAFKKNRPTFLDLCRSNISQSKSIKSTDYWNTHMTA